MRSALVSLTNDQKQVNTKLEEERQISRTHDTCELPLPLEPYYQGTFGQSAVLF